MPSSSRVQLLRRRKSSREFASFGIGSGAAAAGMMLGSGGGGGGFERAFAACSSASHLIAASELSVNSRLR